MELLKEGPLSVREISSATGMPVYTVSLRLGDLENNGKADLHGYEGITPRFARVAA
jgi:DNA-binding Lrp family transcriptional regulator